MLSSVGCGTNPPAQPAPTITSFTATPASLPAGGGSVTLAWTTANATHLVIDNGVGDVTGLTSKIVGVTATTTFALAASNGSSPIISTVTIAVAAAANAPVIASFTATPSSLPAGGGSVTLAWTTSGATSLAIDNNVGTVTGLTSKVVSVTASTTFKLTATNAAGPVTSTSIVSVASAAGITCGPPVTLDSGANQVQSASAVTLASGKYVVSWLETEASSFSISKVRVFDGTQYLPEQTFAGSTANSVASKLPLLAADGDGVAYASWSDNSATPVGRAVEDPATHLFGANAPLAIGPTGLDQPSGLVGLAGGGAIDLFVAAGTNGFPSPTVSQFDPAAGTWGAKQLLLDGNFRVQELGGNFTGLAAASWVNTFPTPAGSPMTLGVATFDGTSWTTNPTPNSSLALTGPGASWEQTINLVYANGDVLFLLGLVNGAVNHILSSVRYHTATGQFDATPLSIDTGGASTMTAFMDSSDRATVIYAKSGQVMASQNNGAGWTTPVSLGTGVLLTAAMAPSGDVAVVISSNHDLRRLTAGGSTWSDPVPTHLTQSSAQHLAMAFDGAGHAVIFSPEFITPHIALQAVTCE